MSFGLRNLSNERLRLFSRGKVMVLPTLARALAYLLSIGFLLGSTRIAVASNESAREAVPASDGWAATATSALPLGTTGGSDAAPRRTVTVTNRAELVAALAWPDASPKLIQVNGRIDANVDDAGKSLTCKDYARPDPSTGEPYSLHAFMAMYDPQGPRKKIVPFGGQENARAASANAQEKRVHILIPPNTTIFGLGSDATLVGAWLDIRPQASTGLGRRSLPARSRGPDQGQCDRRIRSWRLTRHTPTSGGPPSSYSSLLF